VTPSPNPTPAATPTPEPTAKATPKPKSSRYALLTPCPGTSDCYIYVVRSGDNLFSIAKYFGVPLKTVQAMNPWTKSGLVAGRQLRIPTPTR
jgi:LysM repeat protein